MKTKEEYIKKGYTIIHSDKEYITLERAKKFKVGWFITLSIFTGIGGIIYLFWLWSKEKVTIKK